MTTLDRLKALVVFEYGRVWNWEDLPENSIALDGAVQGPRFEPKAQKFNLGKYSLDHHFGCVRMITYATCQQMWHSVYQGLPRGLKLFSNELDADNNVSVWEYMNPDRLLEPRVRELVDRVGLTDAFGPVYKRHPMHNLLQPAYGSKEPQSLEVLAPIIDRMTAYADGTFEPPPIQPQLSKGWSWTYDHGWASYADADADDVPYQVQIIQLPAANGTSWYMVRKRSDLVPVELGPSHHKRPATCIEDCRTDTLLGQLALKELDKNPGQSHGSNWGGATSVGGSPRNEGNAGSVLTLDEVLAIARPFTE